MPDEKVVMALSGSPGCGSFEEISGMELYKEHILVRGKAVLFDAVRIDGKVFVMTGKFLRTAKMWEEWFEDVQSPDRIVSALKSLPHPPDLATFIERPPVFSPRYGYHVEWQKVTALPIKTYKEWWENQISSETRKKAKRAEKRGVEIRISEFNDDLVRGISTIFNESRIRQGTPFWHFGKGFDTVKKEMALDLERSIFIGAYYEGALVGIVKLLYSDKVAEPVIIVSSTIHQNKYLNNALIAKSVEMCAIRGVPYLSYGPYWRRGNMADWLRRNGFEQLLVPRYYVPFTVKGKMALQLKLQLGFKRLFPEGVHDLAVKLRSRWYQARYCRE